MNKAAMLNPDKVAQDGSLDGEKRFRVADRAWLVHPRPVYCRIHPERTISSKSFTGKTLLNPKEVHYRSLTTLTPKHHNHRTILVN